MSNYDCIGTAEYIKEIHRSANSSGSCSVYGAKTIFLSEKERELLKNVKTCGEIVKITGYEPCRDCNK